jgi:SsrA-binding protein
MPSKQSSGDGRKIVATNRKARHDYFLEDAYEAGIVLAGSEIKSIRAGRVNLRDGYVSAQNGELWLVNVHIADYKQSGPYGHDPLRPRKLLLHKKEIARILTRIQEKGYTLIPTLMYLKRGKAKVEIALARGKRQYDKRQTLAERDSRRQIDRALRERDRA